MPRLFVAIDLPAAVTRKLARIQPPPMAGIRLVKPDQMHLTLHFIGEADITQIAAALSAVKFSPFELKLEGVGQFLAGGRAATLWAGVHENAELRELHAAVGAVLAEVGLKPEVRRYTPHVTLARCKPGVPAGVAAEFLSKYASFVFPKIPAARFVLYSSTVVNNAPLYRKEALYP